MVSSSSLGVRERSPSSMSGCCLETSVLSGAQTLDLSFPGLGPRAISLRDAWSVARVSSFGKIILPVSERDASAAANYTHLPLYFSISDLSSVLCGRIKS